LKHLKLPGLTLLQRIYKHVQRLGIGLLFASLAACSATSSITSFFVPKGSRLDWTALTLIATEGANLNTALAVDVVLALDESALAAVTAIPATRWFATRADLAKTYPQTLRYVSVEIAPGQTLKLPAEKLGNDRVLGAVVFADYLTSGEHRVRADQLTGDVVVQLGARSFTNASAKGQ